MPKPSNSHERKVTLAAAALGLVVVGMVVAAHVSDTHQSGASSDDQVIATAVTTADPTPPQSASGLPGPQFPVPMAGLHAATQPALVSRASGDPLLATGFGRLRTAAPVGYANLAVFPVYRTAAPASAPSVTTLDEAMGNGVLSVVEPSLTVNNSGPQPAYVPGGEVVPGGNQDQGVASDAVIPAQSGNVSLASFCVEERRSSGPSQTFNADVAMAIPAVRYAMQVSGDQEQVWGAVAAATDHFGAQSDTGTYHALVQSRTANEATQPYVSALAVPPGRPIGAIVTINGKIVCADVYRESGLFAKVWPALVRSYALQAAMCQAKGTNSAPPVTSADAGRWLAGLDAAPGAQSGQAPGTEAARVATSAGAGVRVAGTADRKALLHEAFWTPEAALTNRT